uniref:ASO_0 protein n=1 Tax=Fopius arisanus TaxID=64838 RepID=A0A0C9RPZ9_9HYME
MQLPTGLSFSLIFVIVRVGCIDNGKDNGMNQENLHEVHARSAPVIEWYSRGSSILKTMEVTEKDPDADVPVEEKYENPHVPLEYGVHYKGLGKLSTPEECARNCRQGAWPKNCYYHFTVEIYRTLGGACTLCEPTTNTSLSADCQCILGDGVDMAGIMVINRMYPGPSVQLCVGDLAIIDVNNRAIGTSISIHWHGVYQKNYQYYDGVPFVTQCPITQGSTFRYRWRAQNAGTHFYHAHTGLHKPDGLEGAIIIRQPKIEDPNNEDFDDDHFDNVIFLNDWFHESAIDHWPGTTAHNVGQIPQNILVNGKGQWLVGLIIC